MSYEINLNIEEEKSEQVDFSLIPAGTKALFAVNKSQVIFKNKDRQKMEEFTQDTGEVLINFEFEILEGAFKSRRIWQDFCTMWNNPPIEYTDKKTGKQAKFYPEATGRGQLGALADACGLESTLSDSSELHGLTFVGAIGVKKSKDPQYADKNELKKFFSNNSSVSSDDIPFTATEQKAKPAWKK